MFLPCVLASSFSILPFVKHVTLRCIFLKQYLADITVSQKLKDLYTANKVKFTLLRSLAVQLHFVFPMESSTTFYPTRTIHHSLNMLTKLSSLSLILLFHLSGMPALVSIKILPIIQGLFSCHVFTLTGNMLSFLNYLDVLGHL